MESKNKSKSALELIQEWSKDRPLWIRDALKQIVNKGLPNNEAIAELAEICMSDHELCDARKAEPLEIDGAEKNDKINDVIRLTKITEVEGVNQLAPNQEIKFGASNLTIIYGPNGAGKSGYTRILKRACNARHRGEIMPNAFTEMSGEPATAQISYRKNDEDQSLSWVDSDKQTPELQAVSVFDRECAATNLKQKNTVLFRPFGLDIPDDLVTVCAKVKEILEGKKQELEQSRDPIFDNPIWSETSDIGIFLNSLKFDSELKSFPNHPKLSEEEISELYRLQTDLASDPIKIAASYKQSAETVKRLASSLSGFSNNFSNEAMNDFLTAEKETKDVRRAAKLAAEEAFTELNLEGVGELVWRQLWDAARRYSETQSNPERLFPPLESDPCALCHQPISANAAKRMGGFEEFILTDTEALAERHEKQLKNQIQKLQGFRFEFRQHALELVILEEHAPDAEKIVKRFLAGLRLRRYQVLSGEDNKKIADLPNNPQQALAKLVDKLNEHATTLLSSADAVAHARLLATFNQLNDRNQSERLTTLATAEISRLKKLNLLKNCLAECGTTTITRLGNDIADEIMTSAMRDRFQEEIIKIATGKIRVEIVRAGGKAGSPQYEIRFFANKRAKVANVLSDGEQTCVALAAHLTELTNEKSGSALVFDDPVTSLDHRWRRKIAERLVEEAKTRQVIVFTHDLVFVNDLHDKSASGTVHLGSLERTAEGCGVYSDNLPWRSAGIKQRVDKMEKDVRAAKTLFDANDEEAYRRTVVEIYGQLRAAWERGLEDRVFAGVIMRHRDYLNTKPLKRVAALDVTDVAAFEDNFSKCCDFVEAHDASRGRDGDVPPPQDVATDIRALSQWEDNLRKKQNALENAPDPSSVPRIRLVE